MVQYDPAVIQEFAERLYKKAMSVVVTYTMIGVLLGSAIGFFIEHSRGRIDMSFLYIGLIVGAVIGYVIGNEKAFWIRLAAQAALCQVQIEKNTRAQNSR